MNKNLKILLIILGVVVVGGLVVLAFQSLEPVETKELEVGELALKEEKDDSIIKNPEEEFFISEKSISELTKEDAKKIIQQRIDAWKDENIDAYTNLLTSAPAPENRKDIKRLLESQGFSISITEGVVIGMKELPFELVNTFSSIADYYYHYNEIKQYYVAIDYKTSEENNYIKNGVSYFLYVFGLEDEGWFIAEASSVPIHSVVDAGYGFGTLEEREERERKEKLFYNNE